MKRTFHLRRMALAAVAAVAVVACGGGGGGGGAAGNASQLIDPSGSPDEVLNAITVKVGGRAATVVSGSPPAPADPAGAPAVSTASNELNTVNDSTAKIDVSFDTDAALALLFIKVAGASGFARVDLGAAKAQAASIELEIPRQFTDGRFCVEISGQDTGGVLFNATTVCLNVRSSLDDSRSAAEVLSLMAGEWTTGCLVAASGEGSGTETLVINGNDALYSEQLWFASPSCAGEPDEVFGEVSQFVLGAELTNDDGIVVREIDVTTVSSDDPEAVGRTEFGVVFADGALLQFSHFADLAGSRTTALASGIRYLPDTGERGDDSGADSTDNTPPGDQTWRFRSCVTGTINGEPVNDCFEDTVNGVEVPQSSGEGEVRSNELSQAYARAVRQACDQGFEGPDPVIENFQYSRSGNGEVGTLITGSIDIRIQGTCNTSNGSFSYDIDVSSSYEAERLG